MLLRKAPKDMLLAMEEATHLARQGRFSREREQSMVFRGTDNADFRGSDVVARGTRWLLLHLQGYDEQ